MNQQNENQQRVEPITTPENNSVPNKRTFKLKKSYAVGGGVVLLMLGIGIFFAVHQPKDSIKETPVSTAVVEQPAEKVEVSGKSNAVVTKVLPADE